MDDPTPTDEAIPTFSDFPTPEGSARFPDDELVGFDHVLGDGRPWRLPHFVPYPDTVWDVIHDGATLRGEFPLADARLAAVKLLLANYDLPTDFAVWLIARATPKVIGDAVNWALFGRRDQLRGYSDWVDSSLLVNGLSREQVPPQLLREVLDQLVATGRAVAVESYTSAGIAVAKRASLQVVNQKITESNAELARRRSEPARPPEPPRPFASAAPTTTGPAPRP